jgi:protein-S-isoprenylcysteine O-methyltransferase Ste14
MRKLLPPDIWVIAILSMVILHFIAPSARLFPGLWKLMAVPVIAAGLVSGFTAYRLFRKTDTPVRPFEEPAALVTSGPYARTRNPMYLGLTLMLAGVGVLLGSVVPFLVVPAFMIILTQSFIVKEEALLTRRFGDGYREYMGRVRRWL